MQESKNMQSMYLVETARNLAREGISTEPIEYDTLPITTGGRKLCWVSGAGGVGYYKEDIKGEADQAKLDHVRDIARTTQEYMTLLDQAPPLKANGLEEGFKLLAEFNNVVLAGKLTRYGAQFVTWEWTNHRTSLWQGDYFGPGGGASNYAAAKQAFTVRSSLLAKSALFTQEQLTEVYRSIHETLDREYPLTDERRKFLESAAEQIKDCVPDLKARVDFSNQKELDIPDSGGMEFL